LSRDRFSASHDRFGHHTHPAAGSALTEHVTHIEDRSLYSTGGRAGHDAKRTRDPYHGEPDDAADDEPAQGLVHHHADALYRLLGISEMPFKRTVCCSLGITSGGRIGCSLLLDLAEDRAEPGHVPGRDAGP